MHSAAFLGYSHERTPQHYQTPGQKPDSHTSPRVLQSHPPLHHASQEHSKYLIHSILHILPLGHSSILHPCVHGTRETHRPEIRVHSPVFHSSCAHPLPLHPCTVTTLKNFNPAIRTMTYMITHKLELVLASSAINDATRSYNSYFISSVFIYPLLTSATYTVRTPYERDAASINQSIHNHSCSPASRLYFIQPCHLT